MSKKKKTIGIIDTSVSNIQSVIYALKNFDVKIKIINNLVDVETSLDGIVMPGIGSFPEVINKIRRKNLENFVTSKIFRIPSLFICIGMQLLFESSEEFGKAKGLGIFKGNVKKIPKKGDNISRTVPHNGWNTVSYDKNSKIFNEIKDNSNFYFTHSYYVDPADASIVSGTTDYNKFKFCSSINFKNVYGCQFHPEKSAKDGLKIYKNWIDLI